MTTATTTTLFEQYDAQLQGRNRESRKVGNNTYLKRRGDDTIAVRLHDTDVVTYHRNGDIVLDTGGWMTVTTKDRINSFIPYGEYDATHCHLERGTCPGQYETVNGLTHYHGAWFGPKGQVHQTAGRWTVGWHERVYAYADRMILHADGTVSGAPDETEVRARDAEVKRIKADIKRFVAGITPERIVTAFENSLGDCFLCRFGSADDHLAEHVREDYFHASLAHLALTKKNRGNPDFCMQMIYSAAQRGQIDSMLTRDLSSLLKKALITDMVTR